MRRRRKNSLWPRAILGTVSVSAVSWIVGFFFFLSMIPVAPNSINQPTDAIVVLTGGSLRLETGLQLLEQRLGKKLFVSGVHRGIDVAELLRVSRQDPSTVDCCIVLDYVAEDTKANARETANWIEKEQYTSIRLVTADYHMARSLLELRMLSPNTKVVPHAVFPNHVKTREWYIYPGTALLLAGEYSKTILTLFRFGMRHIGLTMMQWIGDSK